MEFCGLEIKKTLLLALLWTSCSFPGVISQRIQNLPGEPLTPQDFQNAQTFPEMEPSDNDKPPECEIIRHENDNEGIQKSVDQPNFDVWEGGYVPYLVDIQFGLTERAAIAGAITRLQRSTCIKFITKSFQADYVFIAKRGGPCGSYVGRKGGEQTVSLNADCMTQGSILHEFLHVIGFEHEQCRDDRDQYIRISFYNITENGKHNFLKIGPPRVNYAGPYDLGSITHYSAFAFGRKDGLRTIFPNDKVKGKKMGQRNQMSQIDKFKVNNYYNCSKQIPLMSPYNLTSLDFPLSDFHDSCPEFAKVGACETSYWIRVNCRQSCGNSSAARPTCLDYNENCARWAEDGECQDLQNGDYMSIYCSKSCNFCSPMLPSRVW